MTNIVFTETAGNRNILNTNHPVENQVQRINKRCWLAIFALCNGVPIRSQRYKTKREAIEACKGENQ